ncbi:inorganic phosphate transporter [Thraustotheca clavata]|uniref:Inorganic phosphate transporter n=1 Tax=Thraustotheca clavata TaxID=74557 RepID=A0A1W0A2Q6_9STRA|nr:inorganic phosphate transporter [Thraustotheca clavata]
MHLPPFLVRGLGFFNDAYDLFVMNVVNVVLEEQYGKDVYTPEVKGAVSAAALVGAIIGQIAFGYLADVLGRRVCMIVTCAILILGGVICALASGGSPSATLWILVVARGFLGVGIGGEYPLAAAASAEDASSVESRNQRVSLTFSLQGVGCVTAAIMGNILVSIHAPGPKGTASPESLEVIWRTLFGIGVIPSAFVFLFRYRAEETATFEQSKTVISAGNNAKIPLTFVLKVYGRWLLGTAGAWFLFDIVFYAQNLFSASILKVVGIHNASLSEVTTQNVLVALVALPGYYVAVYFINRLGRRKMQLQGFFFMTLLFLILSGTWESLQSNVTMFIILYGLALFFSNFGPNTSTFVLPTEMFPTPIRARCHGFSAAMGKLGAAIGSYGFATQGQDLGATFGAFAFFCILSIPLTWYCTFDNANPLAEGDAEFDRRLRIFNGTALQDEDFNDLDEENDEEVDVDIGDQSNNTDRQSLVSHV